MGKIVNREHEPLRVPQGWNEQDKSLIVQLENLFSRLFNRKVSKKEDGWCPKLPDDDTNTKYLRQDGTWADLQSKIDEKADKAIVMPIEFGSTTKSLATVLEDDWQTVIPNDSHPHLVRIDAQYGSVYGYLSRYSNMYGSGVVTCYDGSVYRLTLTAGDVEIVSLALAKNTPTVVKSGLVETNSSFTYTPSFELSVIIAQYGAGSILYSVFRASATNVAVSAIKTQSDITVTTSNGTVTVANATGNTYRYRIITLPTA